MFKKCIFILSFLLLLLIQGNSAFADVNWWERQADWDGSAGDGDWFTPANWTGKSLAVPPYTGGTAPTPPDINTCAAVPSATSDVNIKNGDPCCSFLCVSPWNWANLRVNIYPPGSTYIGTFSCGMAFNIGGYTNYTSTNHGTVNMYNGTVITPGPWNPTQPPGGWSDDVNGLWIGGGSAITGAPIGTLNIYGGLMTVPRIRIYRGVANLYGGTLECAPPGHFLMSSTNTVNKINVAGGTLHLYGDHTAAIEDHIAAGRVVPYNTRGDLTYGYASDWTTVTAEPNLTRAWNPNPADGREEVPLTPTLAWSPGDYTNDINNTHAKHNVYFGTDYTEVLNATTPTSVNDINYYKTVQLEMNKDYYWRVDEVNDTCSPYLWRGKVWTFHTFTGGAMYPYPADDSNSGFDINRPYLSWTNGMYVIENDGNGHDVYFGTDQTEVLNATTSTPVIYQGRIQTNKYNLSNLAPEYFLEVDANYYWRIDEVNGPNKWPGRVWNFAHANFYYVDQFNYANPDGTANQDAMLDLWTRDLDAAVECPEESPYGSGSGLTLNNQFYMEMAYFNNGEYGNDFYSENRFDANGCDWLANSFPSGEPKILSISYLGDAANSAHPTYDRMYAMLADTSGNRTGGGTFGTPVYNPDSTAQQRTAWQTWNILLSDLNDPGVDLTAVKYLYIGFGQRCNSSAIGTPGGTGNVDIDNIVLNQPICNPPYGPTADLTGDCFVNLADVDAFVNDWLETDANLYYPDAVAPETAPVIWYDFNETSGSVANNSAGDTNDGTIVNLNDSTWDADGAIGGCLNLGAGTMSCVNVPPAALAPFAPGGNKAALTFSLWINYDINNPMDNWNGLIDAYESVSNNEIIEIEMPTYQTPPQARARIPGIDLSATNRTMSDFGGRWNHYAIVKNADTNVMAIYENGQNIAEMNTASIDSVIEAIPTVFRIGSRWGDTWGFWTGKIDDFKMYDYALNANEIAWLATKGTKYIYVPFMEPSDLKLTAAPNVVNFADYAILAQQWMTEQLWPLP